MSGQELVGAWCAAAMTLFIFSFLYKDNPLYRLAEHIFIGVTVGMAIVLAVWKVLLPDWWRPLVGKGDLWLLIPGIFGLLALTRLIPRYAWLSRWTFAFVMGYAAGLAIPTAVSAFILPHVKTTITPVVPGKLPSGSQQWAEAVFKGFGDLLVLVIVVSVLIYFFFSIEQKGPIRWAARAGMLFLMAAFGIAYGSTVMGRMSLLYGRFFELKDYGGGKFYFATPVLLALTIGGLAAWEILLRKKGEEK